MTLEEFPSQQQQALLDLAILVMYADGHLAQAEDERVHRLLSAMGFATGYARDQQYDASIGRVNPYSQNAEKARAQAVTLAQSFSTDEQRRLVHDALGDLVTSDRHVSLREGDLLSIVREVLQR